MNINRKTEIIKDWYLPSHSTVPNPKHANAVEEHVLFMFQGCVLMFSVPLDCILPYYISHYINT